jgi:acyl carrier protein
VDLGWRTDGADPLVAGLWELGQVGDNNGTRDKIMQIENQIQQYIAENLLFSDRFPYEPDTSFLREGVLDSMGVMELVTYVATAFEIQVDPQDVTPENFDSVNRLANFIRQRQAGAVKKV